MINYLKQTEKASRRRARDEAARWFATLNSADCNIETEQRFRQWLEESPLNALAYEQCRTIWLLAGDLKDDGDIRREIIHARPGTHALSEAGAGAGKRRSARQNLLQIAAMALLTVGTVFFVTEIPENRFSTRIGEQRLVRLPDGSSAMLNTDSAVTSVFDDKVRRIELHRGEAYFSVAKDPSRPFEVNVNGSIVRAVGTEFNVALKNSEVSVAVVEGIVEVEADEGVGRVPKVIAEIRHGQAVRYYKGETAPKIELADLERISAWQMRKVYFKSERLADAVAEYNRYSEREIQVFGDALKDELITGIFNVGDIESFIFSLEQALDVQVVREKNRILLIQKRTIRSNGGQG